MACPPQSARAPGGTAEHTGTQAEDQALAGSYPKTFIAVHGAGYHWISCRAPLAATAVLPIRATIRQYGQDRHIGFTDEVEPGVATSRRTTLRTKIPRNQLHPGAQRAILSRVPAAERMLTTTAWSHRYQDLAA